MSSTESGGLNPLRSVQAFYTRRLKLISQRRQQRTTLREKWVESTRNVLPIAVLVLTIACLLIPVPIDALAAFALAAVMLVFGMGLFNLGTDMAMTPIGQAVGRSVTKSQKLWLVLATGFAVGVLVTIAEPDLTVLSSQVADIPNWVMIIAVAVGVGVFLLLALARILYGISLRLLLLISYGVLFLLALLTPQSFLAVAFDAGGVTTGPMTVPFILGLGIGVAAIRSDSSAEADSFGLVALSSVGPIMAVMLLGILYHADGGAAPATSLIEAPDSLALFASFTCSLPHMLREVGLALAPVALFFAVFQFVFLHLKGRALNRILLGLIYTYAGLVLFLTGVNVGFMPMGYFIGRLFASSSIRTLLIPTGMVIGWFVVSAEPAVQVLAKQVYEMTAGAVSQKSMMRSLQIGVAVSVGLAMARALYQIPVMTLLLPGYGLAMLMTLVCPPVFTAIAFDSGGVASGPLTATFLLPLAMGACSAGVEAGTAVDAFGVVAMVAMTPLITIQGLGILYRVRQRRVRALAVAISHEEILDL